MRILGRELAKRRSLPTERLSARRMRMRIFLDQIATGTRYGGVVDGEIDVWNGRGVPIAGCENGSWYFFRAALFAGICEKMNE
jgi:hypothetical protein